MKALIVVILLLLGSITGSVHADEAAPAAVGKLDRTRTLIEEGRTAEKKPVEAPDMSSAGIKMAQSLALCVAVLLGGAYLVKRYRGGSISTKARSMRIIERLPLTARTSLVLAEVEGRKVLVAYGSENVSFATQQFGDSQFGDALGDISSMSNEATGRSNS